MTNGDIPPGVSNPSTGEVAVPQDSFNIAADKAVSTYDRPHRFTGNFVYELPFFRGQESLIGKILGGWQMNAAFTLQSGAPFTVLNGSDPTGALAADAAPSGPRRASRSRRTAGRGPSGLRPWGDRLSPR